MASSTHPLQEGSFDPLALLRRSQGDASDIRTIKLRMLWLRQRVPEARVKTELVTLDERVVVIAAAISLPDGGKGSGHAATDLGSSSDVAEAIETTELRAIGRALDILGYVITEEPSGAATAPPEQSSPAPQEKQPPREAPGSQPPGHVRAIRSMRERGQQQQPPAPSLPDIDELDDDSEETLPEAPAPERPLTASTASERPREQPPAPPRPTPQPVSDDDEPPLEDVSWTAFWSWARSTYQLRSRNQVEELLGQPIEREVPGKVRQMLIAHFDEARSDES